MKPSVKLIGVLLTLPAMAEAPKTPATIEGHWLGTLNAGVKLRLAVHVVSTPSGGWKSTLDSIDQGAKGIKVDKTTLMEGKVGLELNAIGASFEGRFEGNDKIVGLWKQGGGVLPLVLKRTEKPLALNRPQEPKKPYPYDEVEVTFKNHKANVTLAGTLTLPRTSPPHPAVLLITGSGPQDRDESLMGHRPFLILADHLTRQGIAVLRVDDRGVGGSTGKLDKVTTADLAEDAEAGIKFLKSRPEIDARKIGLLGHSEGGLIAPMVAARSTDVAFIVLLAPPGVLGEDLLYEQGQLILKAAGATKKMLAHQRKLQERLFAAIKSAPDVKSLTKQLTEILDAEVKEQQGAENKLPDAGSKQVEAQRAMMLTPWFRYFLMFDPRPTLVKVKCPTLALFGAKDLQVPPSQSLRPLKEALKAGGNRDVEVKEMPGLNHLFQTAKTGSPSEYGQIEETMSPEVLKTIGDWITRHVKP